MRPENEDESQEDIAVFFIDRNLYPTQGSCQYLKATVDSFPKLWQTWEENHQRPVKSLQVLKRIKDHSFPDGKTWLSSQPLEEATHKTDVELAEELKERISSIFEVGKLTRSEVQVLLDSDQNFEIRFQEWCRRQRIEDRNLLFIKFKQLVNRKATSHAILDQLQRTWPKDKSVNQKTIKIENKQNPEFSIAWQALVDQQYPSKALKDWSI